AALRAARGLVGRLLGAVFGIDLAEIAPPLVRRPLLGLPLAQRAETPPRVRRTLLGRPLRERDETQHLGSQGASLLPRRVRAGRIGSSGAGLWRGLPTPFRNCYWNLAVYDSIIVSCFSFHDANRQNRLRFTIRSRN